MSSTPAESEIICASTFLSVWDNKPWSPVVASLRKIIPQRSEVRG